MKRGELLKCVLLDPLTDRQTDRWMDICNAGVAFMTENYPKMTSDTLKFYMSF